MSMKAVGQDHADPLPLRRAPHGLGTITVRFVGLLTLAIVVLALIWSR